MEIKIWVVKIEIVWGMAKRRRGLGSAGFGIIQCYAIHWTSRNAK
jgi:hypothetical protein